jgi:hypothetical protein
MKNFAILLLLCSLIACKQQSEDDRAANGENNVPETTEQFTFTIRDQQLGNLKTGEPIKDVLNKLKHLTVKLDSIPECEGCNTFSPQYVVSSNDGEVLFVFEPGFEPADRDKLFRLRTTNSKFVTDKGVRVGMTVADVKDKYEITSVDVSGDTGIHLFVQDFNGSFGTELLVTNDWWKISEENVPDDLRIDEIIIL